MVDARFWKEDGVEGCWVGGGVGLRFMSRYSSSSSARFGCALVRSEDVKDRCCCVLNMGTPYAECRDACRGCSSFRA